MEISKRLRQIAEMVTKGNPLVDVGCDHGYLPIWLIEQKRIPKAVAMDIRTGPLECAARNIAAHGLEEYIETRLSDGLSAMPQAEGKTLVIAGMGGPLMEKILTEGRAAADGFDEWILQPQSEAAQFRRSVERMGRKIVQEEIVLDEGKYYPMFRAVPGSAPYRSEIFYRYGKETLNRRDPVLREFLERERRVQEQIKERLAAADTETANSRRKELFAEMEWTREALAYYEMQ